MYNELTAPLRVLDNKLGKFSSWIFMKVDSDTKNVHLFLVMVIGAIALAFFFLGVYNLWSFAHYSNSIYPFERFLKFYVFRLFMGSTCFLFSRLCYHLVKRSALRYDELNKKCR